MIESFKINCYQLNRAIRITISLPKDYNNTNRYYPVIYFLDGQNVFYDKDSLTGVSLDLPSVISKLETEDKCAIYVGIAAAMDESRREKEYKEDILSNFIIEQIHPLLSTRYRMNNFIYSFGCSKAAKTALSLGFSKDFKGSIIISPVGYFQNFEFPSISKLIYLFAGKTELNGQCIKNVSDIKAKYNLANIVTFDGSIHSEECWKNIVYQAINSLIL